MSSPNYYISYRLPLLLILLPLSLCLIISMIYETERTKQGDHDKKIYAEIAAQQIYRQISQHLIEEDLNSVNLLITQLIEEEKITFIQVWNAEESEITKVGKRFETDLIFSYIIRFEDEDEGKIIIGLDNSSHLSKSLSGQIFLLFSVYGIAIWFFSPQIIPWLTVGGPSSSGKFNKLGQETSNSRACILIFRIRPAHYLESYFENFYKAAETYGGTLEQTMREEILISFKGSDPVYDAAKTGFLIKTIIYKLDKSISFGGAICSIKNDDIEARKSTSYLAMMASQALLIDNLNEPISQDIVTQPFHHALFDSERVCSIKSLTNHSAIEEKASQIITQS